MRFEIGIGGGLLIAAGLVTLSAGVFALGLIAGYEMANQEQHNQEVAAVYPLPSPPPALPTPTSSAEANLQASPAFATPYSSPTSAAGSPGGLIQHPGAPSRPSPSPVAMRTAEAPPRPLPVISPPIAAAASSAPSPAAQAAPEGPAAARAKRTPRPERKVAPPEAATGESEPSREHQPYSVQIDAVMDRQGADSMVKRLREGGYEPYIVETRIAGQTWYKVRVGHYQSEAEAHAAEQKLRQDFNGSLPTH
jgi:septal ring-binding cell division protein DamX